MGATVRHLVGCFVLLLFAAASGDALGQSADAEYHPTVSRQAGDYSEDHDAIGFAVIGGRGSEYTPEQVAYVIEDRFQDKGFPSKSFVRLGDGINTVIRFYVGGHSAGDYNLGNVLQSLDSAMVQYCLASLERLQSDERCLQLPDSAYEAE